MAIDPDLLARELAAQLAGDPLDEIELDKTDEDLVNSSKECDIALKWLQSGNEERLQGLRVFCEHRDPRALPFLVPLLDEPSPVIRMSAVYALGRNPCPQALDLLLHLLRFDEYITETQTARNTKTTRCDCLRPNVSATKLLRALRAVPALRS